MKLFDWILEKIFPEPKGYTSHMIHVPTKMNHALEAFAYINEVDAEEVILQSLQEYLTSNLWAAKESQRRTKIIRPKQLRD